MVTFLAAVIAVSLVCLIVASLLWDNAYSRLRSAEAEWEQECAVARRERDEAQSALADERTRHDATKQAAREAAVVWDVEREGYKAAIAEAKRERDAAFAAQTKAANALAFLVEWVRSDVVPMVGKSLE